MGTPGATQPQSSGRWRSLMVTLLVLAAFGYALWRYTRPEPVSVALQAVDRGPVLQSVANSRAGTVNACRRAKLAPPSGGQIVSLPVKEGERVKTGQILLELWDEDYAAQRHVAEEQARTARLRVEEVCSQAEIAERDAERARLLYQDGLIPTEQNDRASTQARTVRAGCNAARAEADRSRAAVESASATLKRFVLRAPFAGIIAKINAEKGEYTMPAPVGIPTPPAVDLIDDSCLYVTAPIDEVDAARIRVGQTSRISIDAFPGQRFPGRVRRIAPYVVDIEKQARTVDVEVEFADPGDVKALLVGYSADVEIILAVSDEALRIPSQALMEGNRVLVYRPADGILEERRVETGLANWDHTEIRSGLEAGEQVVTSVERMGVAPGAHVVPEKPAPR